MLALGQMEELLTSVLSTSSPRFANSLSMYWGMLRGRCHFLLFFIISVGVDVLHVAALKAEVRGQVYCIFLIVCHRERRSPPDIPRNTFLRVYYLSLPCIERRLFLPVFVILIAKGAFLRRRFWDVERTCPWSSISLVAYRGYRSVYSVQGAADCLHALMSCFEHWVLRWMRGVIIKYIAILHPRKRLPCSTMTASPPTKHDTSVILFELWHDQTWFDWYINLFRPMTNLTPQSCSMRAQKSKAMKKKRKKNGKQGGKLWFLKTEILAPWASKIDVAVGWRNDHRFPWWLMTLIGTPDLTWKSITSTFQTSTMAN